jgi:ribosome-associated translation inhibitor RaiA
MKLQIRTRGVFFNEQLRSLACEKIDHALHRIRHKVTKITMHLFDANGPDRGGADQACRLVVHLEKQGAIVLQDTASNLGLVLDRVSDRLDMAVSRRADRKRSKRSLQKRRWSVADSLEA